MTVTELYIYGSAFDLPTIDPQCLAVISYLSIVSHQDYTIIECNDPGLSPTGELPMLHDGKHWVSGTNRIISYLSKIDYNANEHLSKENHARLVAYSALVDESLTDALLFSWFADADNFLGSIRKEYSRLLPIPSRYITPLQMRKSAVQRVQKYGGHVDSGVLTKAENTKIYDLARDCYRVLDRKLGEQEFFFGDRPSSLDAKVFGYLALQLYPEIPNPRFQAILNSQFPRLVAFCDRCRDEFFSNLPDLGEATSKAPSVSFFRNPFAASSEWFSSTFFGQTAKGSSIHTEAEPHKKTSEERDFDLKRIYAVTFGVVAMVAYVIINGLVVVSDEDEEDGHFIAGGADDLHSPIEDDDD